MTALGPGVSVKCIVPKWFDLGGGCVGPSLGSVWTVARVIRIDPDRMYLSLVEWTNRSSDLWRSLAFVPLDGNEDLSALEGALNKGRVDSDDIVTVTITVPGRKPVVLTPVGPEEFEIGR